MKQIRLSNCGHLEVPPSSVFPHIFWYDLAFPCYACLSNSFSPESELAEAWSLQCED